MSRRSGAATSRRTRRTAEQSPPPPPVFAANPIFLCEDGGSAGRLIKPGGGVRGYGPGSLHALVRGRGRDVAADDDDDGGKLLPLPLPPSRAHREGRGGTRVPAWHAGPTIVVGPHGAVVRIRAPPPPQQHDPFLAAYVACTKGRAGAGKNSGQATKKKKKKAKAAMRGGCGMWNGWASGARYARVMSCRHGGAVTVLRGAAPLPAVVAGNAESPAHPTLDLSRLPAVLPGRRRGEVVRIQGDEFWHMTRVLRLGINDRVELFDGAGGLVEGSIQKVDKGGSDVELLEDARLIAPQGIQWHVYAAFGTLKGGRADWLVEKCTELGACSVTPLLTERCHTVAGNRVDRLQRLVLAAVKQCQRIHGMLLNPPIQIADLQPVVSQSKLAFLASAESPPLLSTLPKSFNEESGLLIVGPEGDFTEEEVNVLKAAGAVPVGLGPCRLRVETATISLLSALMLWSDAHCQETLKCR
uniref:16S rRNA (uracil(1498)-N(3))-methyltransferase n=1 Tax=Oryza punctata TaxID=4537 RepID=A0A0E0KIJ8_ORYPU